MKRLKWHASSIGCIGAVIPILLILFMSPWALPDDRDNGHNAVLYGIAVDRWKFYAAEVDPNTNLPTDSLTWAARGPLSSKGQYTSASNIGVYLWAVGEGRFRIVPTNRQPAHEIEITGWPGCVHGFFRR